MEQSSVGRWFRSLYLARNVLTNSSVSMFAVRFSWIIVCLGFRDAAGTAVRGVRDEAEKRAAPR